MCRLHVSAAQAPPSPLQKAPDEAVGNIKFATDFRPTKTSRLTAPIAESHLNDRQGLTAPMRLTTAAATSKPTIHALEAHQGVQMQEYHAPWQAFTHTRTVQRAPRSVYVLPVADRLPLSGRTPAHHWRPNYPRIFKDIFSIRMAGAMKIRKLDRSHFRKIDADLDREFETQFKYALSAGPRSTLCHIGPLCCFTVACGVSEVKM